MCFCNQKSHTLTLLWKNFIIWKRTPWVSTIELLVPILLIAVLVYMRTKIDHQIIPSVEVREVTYDGDEVGYTAVYHYPLIEETRMTVRKEEEWMEETYAFAGVIPRSRLFFIPKACFWTGNYATQKRIVGLAPKNEYTESIAFQIKRWLTLWKKEYGFILDLEWQFFESKEAMHDYVRHPEYMMDIKNRIGLCFGITHSEDTDGDGFTEHRFDLHFDDQKTSDYKNIPSQLSAALDKYNDVPDIDSYYLYARQGFNLMQNWCANAILRASLKNLDASIISLIKPMRTNEFVKDDFLIAQQLILPIYMIIIFLLPIYRMISNIVTERMTKTKDVSRSMGIQESSYWLSWFLFYFIGMTVVTFAQACLLTFGLFKYSELGPVFAVLWLYGLALFGYIVFVSAFFSKPTLASIVGSLVFFASSFIDAVIEDPFLDEHLKLIASIMPSVAIQRCFIGVSELERTRRGLTSATIMEPVLNIRISYYLVMMAFFFVFFTAVGIYFTQVLPHAAGGFREHVCYCFGASRQSQSQKGSRKNQRRVPAPYDEQSVKHLDTFEFLDKAKYASQRESGKVLRLQRLTKFYGPRVKAVDDLNVDMYGGEIFALLGHNGAGKTTTIKMVIGLIESTSGRMVFQKKDLALNRKTLHHEIGVCPQENILYDTLTVLEHFRLFAELRASSNDLESQAMVRDQIEKLILDLDLSDYRNVQAQNLSGGNKRKLQVGLAFVGDSCNLILLDEPTAGLDIAARRRMWNMLETYKQDRVIILTTHYMDEAEILGDRIGIMSQGKLVCLGTTQFLTQRFGTGAKITIDVRDKDVLTRFIEKFKNQRKKDIRVRPVNDAQGRKLVLQIPYAKTQLDLALILAVLESKKEEYGITTTEISETSLEQVFIQVANLHKSHQQDEQLLGMVEKEEGPAIKTLKKQISDELVIDRRCEFCKHALLLVKKRVNIYRRSIKTLMMEIFIPLVLILTGFTMSKIQFLFESEPRELSTDMYGPGIERIIVNKHVINPADDQVLKERNPWIQAQPVFEEETVVETERRQLDAMIGLRDLQGSSIFDFNINGDPAEIPPEVDPKEVVPEKPEGEEDPTDGGGTSSGSSNFDLNDPTKVDDEETTNPQVPEDDDLAQDSGDDGETNNDPTETTTPVDDESSTEDGTGISIWDDRTQSTSLFVLGELSERDFDTGPALGDKHLTAEQFVAALPNSRQAFKAKYVEYPSLVEENGYQGRDAWKNLEREVYELQNDPDLMDVATSQAYGSYFLYEMNNSTKQFKVGTLVNTTQSDSAALYPQYMYESIIKLATGDPKLKFTVVNSPWPLTEELKEQEQAASSIFLVFVITISFALMQASTISFVCHEKERKLKHIQFIQGMSKKAYWCVNFTFDLFKTLLVSLTIYLLIKVYDLDFPDTWVLLLEYPFAIVPFTYATSFLFSKESTAQNCTIFIHLIFGSIASSSVFVMRLIRQTEDTGDMLNDALKVFPSYSLSSGMLYASSKQLMNETREYTPAEIFNQTERMSGSAIKRAIESLPERTNITLESFDRANIGGDIIALAAHCIFGILFLINVETGICLVCCQVRRSLNRDDKQSLSSSENKNLIEVRDLNKVYNPGYCKKKGDSSLKTKAALHKTSFHVTEHECFSLLGENGAGKSTSFKILTGDASQTSGQVRLLGHDSDRARSLVAKEMGYCPQDDVLFDLLTVEEHLYFYARLRCLANRKVHIDALIESLQLTKDRHKLSMNLSGGNKRKLSVGIALVGKPRLILLDEPSTGVDPDARQHMWLTIGAFQQIGQRSSAILLTTHSMEEAETLSTRLAIMTKGGKIACHGSTQQIKSDHGKSFHVDMTMKNDEDAFDGSCDQLDSARNDINPLKIEILQQFQWSREEAIKVLKLRQEEHLAAQLETRGIFCPKELYEDDSIIPSKDFVAWFSLYHKLMVCIYRLLTDRRITEIQVLPPSPDQAANSFKLRVEKELDENYSPLSHADLILQFSYLETLKAYTVSETSLEQIFQQFIQNDKEKLQTASQLKQALRFTSAPINLESKGLPQVGGMKLKYKTFIMLQEPIDGSNKLIQTMQTIASTEVVSANLKKNQLAAHNSKFRSSNPVSLQQFAVLEPVPISAANNLLSGSSEGSQKMGLNPAVAKKARRPLGDVLLLESQRIQTSHRPMSRPVVPSGDLLILQSQESYRGQSKIEMAEMMGDVHNVDRTDRNFGIETDRKDEANREAALDSAKKELVDS